MSNAGSMLVSDIDTAPSIDIVENDPFYYAQDVNGWLDKLELNRTIKEKKFNKNNRTKKCKCLKKSSSYILKNIPCKERYLIKIKVEALNEDDNDQAVIAQYIMSDQYDSVMDAAQSVVKEIYKKIHDQ